MANLGANSQRPMFKVCACILPGSVRLITGFPGWRYYYIRACGRGHRNGSGLRCVLPLRNTADMAALCRWRRIVRGLVHLSGV